MTRIPRSAIVAPGQTYHLIARGNNRMRIFRWDEDYTTYLTLLDVMSRSYGIRIHHYALMPNHVHLLVKSEGDLTGFMRVVQGMYAKRFSKKYRHTGHVWSSRFKSLLISSDPYLFACGNYIEMNPVRAHLVAKPEEWKYSSYKTYAFGHHDQLVTLDPFYPEIAGDEISRQTRYRDLVAKTRSRP